MQGPQDFTLIMANVEWIREEDDFIGLRCCRDITIRGPLVLDADPLPFSQCAVTGSDGATYLDLEVMPGYILQCCDHVHLCLSCSQLVDQSNGTHVQPRWLLMLRSIKSYHRHITPILQCCDHVHLCLLCSQLVDQSHGAPVQLRWLLML